ncbi:MAG: GTP-binding protein YchF [Clostridia bacterium 41_269]|nr:MAG: GTP-binding protein YchF [Clostridia bacterium 41_269]
MAILSGIIGLPAVGKSTVFDILTSSAPSRHGQVNIGTVAVPDSRLDYLWEIYRPEKKVYASMEVMDIPGLNPKEMDREQLRKFLEEIRRADVFIHVVRGFRNDAVWHVEGEINIKRDIDIINTELILNDLQLVETRISSIEETRKKKGISSETEAELSALLKYRKALEEEVPICSVELSEFEEKAVRHLGFLTSKPMVLVINLDEEQLSKGYDEREYVHNWAEERGYKLIEICASLEQEISELDKSDQMLFLKEIGMEQPGSMRIARAVFESLDLITFFTVGKDEVKAWVITEGTNARKAAGKIHSDMERGFIRAEVVSFEDFKACGSEKEAKKRGLYRLEGKDYIVKDGDIIQFRFNV